MEDATTPNEEIDPFKIDRKIRYQSGELPGREIDNYPIRT